MEDIMEKILLVDDERSILESCRQMLAMKDFEVRMSENLSAARKELLTFPFDLVITDMRLGADSGEDVLREVREHYPQTGVIVMTGYVDIQNAVQCMRDGADDYLPKPFEIQDFYNTVEKYFERRRLKNEVANLKEDVSLFRLALAVTELKPLSGLLDSVLELIIKETDSDSASLALLDEEISELEVKLSRGECLSRPPVGSRIKLGEGICGYVAKKREPVFLNRNDESRNVAPGHFQLFSRHLSQISVPMVVGKKFIGVMEICREKPKKPFTSRNLEKTFILAQISALAISNARVYDKLRELDELKSHFLSIASHELRTPLAAIKGAIDLIEKTPEPANAEKLIAIAKRNALRMMRLVNDILGFSSMERGNFAIHKKKSSLANIVSNSVETVRSKAETRKILITVAGSGELPEVFCDPEAMEQVLGNLLDNAIKYSPEKSEVSIDMNCEGPYLKISVTDKGPGITAQEHKRIFERFYQIDRSLSRETGGIGLGLSIVKKIVELHNGEISVVSSPEQGKKGSRFTVKIPIEEAGTMSPCKHSRENSLA